SESQLFRSYVLDRMRAQGLAGPELIEAMNAVGRLTTPLAEPALLYFHRRAFDRAVRWDAFLELAEDAGLVARPSVPGQLIAAVAFVDLSSFTPLTEAKGDARAVDVLARFAQLVRAAVARHDGRVAKEIGDAFMLIFRAASQAVGCVLEIEAGVAAEPQFPAVRGGVPWGAVGAREGDCVRPHVTVAAGRAAAAARPQVLVTAAVRREASRLAGVDFIGIGKRRLKGVSEELELYEARPSAAATRERVVDPVCGMELG